MGKFVVKHDLNYIKNFAKENGCEFLSEVYNGCLEKYEFRCSCGNTFITTFRKFESRNKRQCNACGGKIIASHFLIPFEEISERISSYNKSTLLTKKEDYINTKVPLDFLCECGNVYKRSYLSYTSSTKMCKKCSEKGSNEFKMKYTYDYVYDFLEKNNCKLLTKKNKTFIRVVDLLDVECSCGDTYTTSWAIIKTYNKFKCDSCNFKTSNFSKGERKISEILDNNNIIFKPQYTNHKCKNIQKLQFDFAIFENDNLKLLIEYDGIQHFKPYDYYGGEETFEKVKIRDEIKNSFCKENNIPLLRIAYYDYDNIEKILIDNMIIPC